VLAEVVKCKDAGVVKTKIDNFVQEGEEFLAQFKKVTLCRYRRGELVAVAKNKVFIKPLALAQIRAPCF